LGIQLPSTHRMKSGGRSLSPKPHRCDAQERNAMYHCNNNNDNFHAEKYKNQPRHPQDPYNMARLDAGTRGITAESHNSGGLGPQRSVEGWIIFVTGLDQEAQEDDILDVFSEYGPVKSIHVHLDIQTGFCKGYALIEYNEKSEAQDAINALHGTTLLGKSLKVDWAFVGGGDATSSTSMRVEGVSRKKAKRG